MKASTHVGFAGLLYLVFLTTTGVALTAENALVLAVGSILPDIDSGSSTIGRLLPPFTRFLERRFGHRTLTHSIPFTAVLFLLFLVPILSGADLFTCLLVGYASHPVLDTCTPNGVRLFYPFSGVRCVFPFDGNAPHRFRVESGSRLDRALGIFFFAACLPALYVAQQGYERFIRVAQHTIESAVRDYEIYAGCGTVDALMEARDQLSGEKLKGKFHVVGALNAHSLLFEGPDGRLHSLGRDFESDFIADNVICVKGDPAHTSVRTIDMSGQIIGSLAGSGDGRSESYYFGEFATGENPVIPVRVRSFSPVTGSGRRIRMNYARESDIRDLNLGGVLATGGTLLVKTVTREGAPGDSVACPASPSGGTLLQYPVTPGEFIEFRKKKGDTVSAGELLAIRTVPAYLDEQRALNERKRESAGAQERLAVLALDRDVADAALAVSSDSLEYFNASELVRRGYASAASLTRAELTWDRSKRALGKLLAARSLMTGKIALDAARLTLAEAELRAKAGLHALKSEIRSPYAGMLIDVRREPFNGKERIVFMVRRMQLQDPHALPVH